MEVEPSFDEVFDKALHAALSLSNDATSMIRSSLRTSRIEPDSSIYGLHIAATASYRGALTCLLRSETSMAASPLLRAVLEAWSHIEFIADDDEGGDARCRSLRYERGTLKAWSELADGPLASLDLAAWRQQHRERIREIDALWTEFGCEKAPILTHHVQPTLAKMAKRYEMTWLVPLWKHASTVAHGFGTDLAFHSDGVGPSDLVWIEPAVRAYLFENLVIAYGRLTMAGVSVLGGTPLDEVVDGMAQLIAAGDILLRKAMDEGTVSWGAAASARASPRAPGLW